MSTNPSPTKLASAGIEVQQAKPEEGRDRHVAPVISSGDQVGWGAVTHRREGEG